MSNPSHPFPVGSRVRNYGEQYPKALQYGTAVVLAFRPSGSSRFEYRVQRDKPLVDGMPNLPTWWASHRTYVAREAEVEVVL